MHAREVDGETPLHLSAYHGHLGVTDLLLKHGANIHDQNGEGETPFDLASMEGHNEVAKLLVPEGRAILQRMTVEENLRLAAEMLPARGERAQDKPASAPRVQDQIDEQLRNFPSLERRRALPAGQNPSG